jgi:riboflavin kinase/FMN adenylyltransferase
MTAALHSITMKIYEGIEQYQPPAGGTVLSIGNFDGVHLGHRHLLDTAREKSRELSAPVVVVTFDPHPLAVIRPQHASICLTTCAEKVALLETCGVDATIILRSNRELLDKTAQEFLVSLVERCRPRAIVEGPTFNFGRGREGSIDTLRAWAGRLEFDLAVVDELRSRELTGNPAINSSTIRNALCRGQLGEANLMLGRPYRLTGVVAAGQQRGATLGFPTANLTGIPQLLPGEAVYAGAAQLVDGSLHLAAVNIGPQPTFVQEQHCVEAHVIDYSGELRGQPLGLHLFAKLRAQVRFASADQLAAQLRHDVEQTRMFAEQLTRTRAERRLPL